MTSKEKLLQYISMHPFQNEVQMYNHGKRFGIDKERTFILIIAEGWTVEFRDEQVIWWNPSIKDKKSMAAHSDFYQNKLGGNHIKHKEKPTIFEQENKDNDKI